MTSTRITRAALLGLALAAPLGAQCPAPTEVARLDGALFESSGLAPSRTRPGVFWTLLDSDGDSAVFAVDTAGALRQRVRVAGASNRDWEDLASGPCPEGTGDCLWIADTGDNLEVHAEARLYVVPEPAPGDSVTPPARVYRAAFPDGPRDTEAIFVSPDGRPYLVSKGRNGHPVRLLAFPLGGGVGRMRALQTLAPRVGPQDGITGAAISADGAWVALRSYTEFVLYRVSGRGRALRLAEVPGTRTAYPQTQGEAVAFGPDALYFTSEERPGQQAPLTRTRCAGPWRAGSGASHPTSEELRGPDA